MRSVPLKPFRWEIGPSRWRELFVFSKNATVIELLLFDGNLTLSVCHFPPGTSKWNQIEHRLFCLHHPELARPTAGQPPSDRAT